ncbi:MAG: ABC transporter permease [Bacillota bacterium]
MTRKPGLSISGLVWKVFGRNLTVFKKTWRTNIMFNFLEPLLYLAAMGFGLGSFVNSIDGLNYVNWLAPALIASSSMWATATECTYDSFIRMHYQKTYHAITATPVNVEEVAVGELAFGTFKGVLYGTVILLLISVLGFVPSPSALLIPIVLVVGGMVFAELAMAWTGLVPHIDSFSYFFTLVVTPMFLFSGVFFPLTGMPKFVGILAWFTPLYHLVNLTRGLALGQLNLSLFWDFLWLVVAAAALFILPVLLMRRRLIQ